jgi:hypothetical protein
MIGAIVMAAYQLKDQAEFDLDRFVDMFDQALTSDDPRVMDALRSLMMMVILTKPENKLPGHQVGPLRRLVDEQRDLVRRVGAIDERLRRMHRDQMEIEYGSTTVDKYMSDVVNSATVTGK